jgi:hypothetical protein
MDEASAREKIRAAYNRLRSSRSPATEAMVRSHSSSVDHHIDAIRKAGDGEWNEAIARDYVRNLELQLEEEIEASGAGFRGQEADDTVTLEETDDPVRELGVSPREFRNELRKLEGEDEDYDSDDMREYVEDQDDPEDNLDKYR